MTKEEAVQTHKLDIYHYTDIVFAILIFEHKEVEEANRNATSDNDQANHTNEPIDCEREWHSWAEVQHDVQSQVQ